MQASCRLPYQYYARKSSAEETCQWSEGICTQSSLSLLGSEKENVMSSLENVDGDSAGYWQEGPDTNISYTDYIMTNLQQVDTQLKSLPADYFPADLTGFISDDTAVGDQHQDQQGYFLPAQESSFAMPF